MILWKYLTMIYEFEENYTKVQIWTFVHNSEDLIIFKYNFLHMKYLILLISNSKLDLKSKRLILK